MKRINQDLVIMKELARGGMGEVFLAKKIGANGFQKDVALKRIVPNFNTPDAQDSFVMEAQVLANIHHPNIVQVYSFSKNEHQFLLEMEYIQGQTLRSILTSWAPAGKFIPLPAVCFIISEVAAGLAVAHNFRGSGQTTQIIHRDISPDNIMLSYSGDVKLIDFGIAKLDDVDLTKTDVIKGKCSYMSPQQALGDRLDPRTDIFSLGVVFWELLCGVRLFAGPTDYKTLDNVINKAVPTPLEMKAHIPKGISDIVVRALERDLNKRIQSADEMVREIKKYFQENSIVFGRSDLNHFMQENFAVEIQKERAKKDALEVELKAFLGDPTKLMETVPSPVAKPDIQATLDFIVNSGVMNKSMTMERSQPIAQQRKNPITKILGSGVVIGILLVVIYLIVIFSPYVRVVNGVDGYKIEVVGINSMRDFCPNYYGGSRFECFVNFVLPIK